MRLSQFCKNELQAVLYLTHHTIDRLEERGVERGSARRPSLKGRQRAIVSQMSTGTVSKATLEKRLGDGVERIWANIYYLELN